MRGGHKKPVDGVATASVLTAGRLPDGVRNVTDRVSNPFGLVVPDRFAGDDDPRAVYGYGDANADFHVIGDRPSVHGGDENGVPFTGSVAGERLQRVLHETGFLAEPYADAPTPENLYLSYLFMGRRPRSPDERAYGDLERYFDTELRAINAHILLPVGERAIDHVLEGYTTQRRKFGRVLDEVALHATEVRGRGFLVVPVREPAEWTDADERALVARLDAIRNRDYRQTKGVATRVG
jgi:uracil-DNA glycosylase family 4